MRGPGYKVSGDVRRTWRCSICGSERKLMGDVTSLQCRCREGTWMHIVSEIRMIPRPVQRPSDIERRPVDFGIEPPAPAPPKVEATIIKSAISYDFDSQTDSPDQKSVPQNNGPEIPETKVTRKNDDVTDVDDDWGEGIF